MKLQNKLQNKLQMGKRSMSITHVSTIASYGLMMLGEQLASEKVCIAIL